MNTFPVDAEEGGMANRSKGAYGGKDAQPSGGSFRLGCLRLSTAGRARACGGEQMNFPLHVAGFGDQTAVFSDARPGPMKIDGAFQPSREIGVGRARAGRLIPVSDRAAAGRQVRSDLIAPIHAIRRIGVAGTTRRSRWEAGGIGKTRVAIRIRPERERSRVMHTVDIDICVGIADRFHRARIALPNIIAADGDEVGIIVICISARSINWRF